MVVLILLCSLMGPGLMDLTRTYLVLTFSVMERRVGVWLTMNRDILWGWSRMLHFYISKMRVIHSAQRNWPWTVLERWKNRSAISWSHSLPDMKIQCWVEVSDAKWPLLYKWRGSVWIEKYYLSSLLVPIVLLTVQHNIFSLESTDWVWRVFVDPKE